MYHYCKKLLFIIGIVVGNNTMAESRLLVTPLCNETMLNTLSRSWSANWSFPDSSDIISISYDYGDGTTAVALKLRSIEHLTEHEQTLCIPCTTCWLYQSDTLDQALSQQGPQKSHEHEGEYTIFDRREYLGDETATLLSAEQVADLIKNKRIL